MKVLAELKYLSTLCLNETNVRDSALKQLSAFRGLKRLYLRDTNMTAAGLKAIETILPNCTIFESVDF